MGGPSSTEGGTSFLAGCFAGVVGCVVGHPFDTLKLVQQTSSGSISMICGYEKLVKTGGHLALWRGLGPALAVQTITSGFLFGTQTSITAKVSSSLGHWGWLANGINGEGNIGTLYQLQQAMSVSTVTCATFSGFLTGGLLAPLVCPLEGFKCRSQVNNGTYVKLNLGRLYSGFFPSVLRCSFGNAAFFGVYEIFQSINVNPAVGGAFAGAAFWVVGFPFDVIKSRMQTFNTSRGSISPSISCTIETIRAEMGFRGLYAGLPVTLLRAVPMNAAVLLTYELLLRYSIS